MPQNYAFGSDNHSGVHPEIMQAIVDVNQGYTIAYGDDEYTKQAKNKFNELFGEDIAVFFLYNGTATNILGLKAVTDSYHAIICAETAHLNVHECCGPEKFIGCKIQTIQTPDGKLTIDLLKPYIVGFNDPHMAQPKVVSITQPTELGTLYTIEEISVLADFVHEHNMLLHMDGARLSNAAASLNKSLRQITKDAGVDVLSFGGTKNGMMFGEAVVFFDASLAKNFEFIRKQGMQLASKMRFIAVQFTAFLSNDLWLKNARHANKMTQLLASKLSAISQINITQKVEANTVFVIIPSSFLSRIQKKYFFHVFNEHISECRLMCSFDTSEDDVKGLVETIQKIVQ